MTRSLIVAVARNDVIGKDNRMPWRISEDLRYFKRVTLGKPVIMGRKTYDSLGKPLPGRPNIVVTRDPHWRADGVYSAASIDAALTLAEQLVPGGEIMVIGGEQIYTEVLPIADRLYLTEVHRAYDGDAFFRLPNKEQWREISREDHLGNPEGDPDFSFVVLERV